MGYTIMSDMMSFWQKYSEKGRRITCALVVLCSFLMLSACSKPKYVIVNPSLNQLRQMHIVSLEKLGGHVVTQGQTVWIYLPSDRLFAPRSANLVGSAYPYLDAVASLLPLYNTETVQVSGYSDNLASANFLTLLTRQQAAAVVGYLWPNNVDAAMVYARGMGAKNPIASNASAGGRSTNRRIVIQLRYYPVIKRYN